MNQEFAKFVQPKPLNIRRFEILLGSIYGGYDIPTDLLNKEKADRLNLFHTLGTVHLMEKFVQKVERVSDQERNAHKLCPKTGQGITK